MNREHAPEERYDLLFIIGCARSGTTWLQLLLAQHPAVSTINESHLFDRFVGPALRSWDDLAADPRQIGLSRVLDRSEFLTCLTEFARSVFERTADPGTRLIVDKTPDHALWIDAVTEVFPNAAVLHLVRDPRSVCSSLVAAGRSWGKHWAPSSTYDAAFRWVHFVSRAREASRFTSRYREVCYEDLYQRPKDELAELFAWLDLGVSEEVLEEAVRETRIDRMREGGTRAPWNLGDEPDGFIRSGGTESWRRELSRGQRRVVEFTCGELMEVYGYEPESSLPWPPARFLPSWLRDQLLRVL